MPFLPRLALVLLCATGPFSIALSAQADDQAQKPVTDCAGLLANFPAAITIMPDSVVEPVADGCHATNIFITAGGAYARWRVADARVTGKDLFTAIGANRMPEALEVSLNGTGLAIANGRPVTEYIMQVTQTPYNVHLAYRWDHASHDLVLDDLSLKGPRFGGIAFSGTAKDVTHMPKLDGAADEDAKLFSLSKLSARLDNRGVFEGMVVVPLVSMLPPDEDPRPAIAQMQQMASGFIAMLPETVASADSKAALKDFIAAFPHPAGVYQFGIESKQPIPAEKILDGADHPQALAPLLGQLTVSATHVAPVAQ